MDVRVGQIFEISVENIIMHADKPTERLSGQKMSDINFVIPIKNISSKKIKIGTDDFHVAFKDKSGKLFFVGTVWTFKECYSGFELEQNQKKILKFSIVSEMSVYNRINELRTLLISINNLPPFCVICNDIQGNWKALDPLSNFNNNNGIYLDDLPVVNEPGYDPAATTQESPQYKVHENTDIQPPQRNDLGDFKYVCPHCGQHFDCPPECEGVACICPTCNNTIYPERPQEVKKHNSTLIISCAFLGSSVQNSSNSSFSVNVQDTNNIFTGDKGQDSGNTSNSGSFSNALDQLASSLEGLASALGGGSSEDEDDADDESDDIDWDEIDSDMQSDMDDELDSIADDTVYDMPSEATEDFEQAAEEAWASFRSSSSFRSEFRTWRDENGYDDDDDDFAEDSMKDEWIDDWKLDNEDDWNQTWCEEHVDDLKERWHKEKEEEWKKEWARNNADYHNVTESQILEHWGVVSHSVPSKNVSNNSNNKKTEDNSTNRGENDMKNKIPVEMHFKTASGQVTACLQNGEIILFCDLSYPDEDKKLGVRVYDEDGDICGSQTNSLWCFRSTYTISIANGSKPVRVVLREQ